MKLRVSTLTRSTHWRCATATTGKVLMIACLALVSFGLYAQQYRINLDSSLDSSEFFNITSVEHRNSYVVSRHWWDGVSNINIIGLNNEELYSSAQNLRDTSMSLNHKLLNYHWLSSWSNLGNNSLQEDNTKKQLRKAGHMLLSYSWEGYINHNTPNNSEPPGTLNIKYRLRLNHDKAKFSLSIGF